MKFKWSALEKAGAFSASAHEPSSCADGAKPGRFVPPPLDAAPSLRHFLKLHSRSAGYAAFMAMVLACLLAAATVASNDHLPLMLGGL